MARAPFLAPRYNIAPTQLAPVIYMERHQPAMKLMRWGLIPSWAKDGHFLRKLILDVVTFTVTRFFEL
jgi:putative SOS response-associated peptidase YedK